MYLYTLIMPNFQKKKIPLCRKVQIDTLKHIYRTRPFISIAMYIHFGKQWRVSIGFIWNY